MTTILIMMFLVMVAMFLAIFVINSRRVEALEKKNIQIQLQMKALEREFDVHLDKVEREMYRYIGDNNKEIFQSIDKIVKLSNQVQDELKEMVLEKKDESIPKLPKKKKQ